MNERTILNNVMTKKRTFDYVDVTIEIVILVLSYSKYPHPFEFS